MQAFARKSARTMNFLSRENNFVRKGVIQGGQTRQNLMILFADEICRATPFLKLTLTKIKWRGANMAESHSVFLG